VSVDLRWTDPAEDDGGAVQDAALWLHLQAAADVASLKLSPVHLRDQKHQNISRRRRTVGRFVIQSEERWFDPRPSRCALEQQKKSCCEEEDQTVRAEEEELVWTSSSVGAPWLQNRKCSVSAAPTALACSRSPPGGSAGEPGFSSTVTWRGEEEIRAPTVCSVSGLPQSS